MQKIFGTLANDAVFKKTMFINMKVSKQTEKAAKKLLLNLSITKFLLQLKKF